MHFRLKKYIESPYGVWCRIKRDIPYLIRGTTYYAECAKKANLHSYCSNHTSNASDYLSHKSGRTAKSVIYTCIVDGYDDVSRIATPSFIEYDCDYVCFTDNPSDIAAKQIGVWDIRPLEYTNLDNTRNNRWHKMHPHELFREYSDSLYIDANVDILSHSLLSAAKALHTPIAIPSHPLRDCIYDEYSNAFAEFIDNPRIMRAELDLIKASGMPRHYGLTENNVIYRQHNDPRIIEIMNEWWSMTTNYSRRDQLSLAWLLWKHNIKISEIAIPHWHRETNRYCVHPHQRSLSYNSHS